MSQSVGHGSSRAGSPETRSASGGGESVPGSMDHGASVRQTRHPLSGGPPYALGNASLKLATTPSGLMPAAASEPSADAAERGRTSTLPTSACDHEYVGSPMSSVPVLERLQTRTV